MKIQNIDKIQPALPRLINEKELSEITGRSLSSIRKDRMRGIGVRFIKYTAGGKVAYDMRDVEAFLSANKKSFTTETSPAIENMATNRNAR